MTKFRAILTFALMLLLVACGSDKSELIEQQQEKIVTFLTTKHSPKLIYEGDTEDSLEAEPEFFTTTGYKVYRFIEDYYNPERESRTEVTAGDKVELTFWCYDFGSFATPTDSYLYYTNDPKYKTALEEAGLNTEYWSFEPKSVRLGRGDILKSIETALIGCKEGDKVEMYLTYNMAYGDMWMGVSSKESPIAFFCTINTVEN